MWVESIGVIGNHGQIMSFNKFLINCKPSIFSKSPWNVFNCSGPLILTAEQATVIIDLDI